ncbi:ABC transporter permease [Paenibacillus mendelii]|uniref:ABC transporter permease n=1 Tax=Paenibacillus mendelii TaxID=206163 RepID=A0ABV6JFB1_9BACL|nr:ABC transporter permease [Paenibacillus mendelii]MCQ6557484.1 ABC transporter permease [Paenibacillus mendelii]
MNNLIQSEWYKLRKDRSFRALILIISASALFWSIFQHIDRTMDGEAPPTGIEMWMSALLGNYIMIIGMCVLAGFFISSEYTTGVMKGIAASGNTRGRIIVAKQLVYALGCIILGLLFPLINGIVATMLSGVGELPDESILLYFVRTVGLLVLFAAGFSSIATLIATFMAEGGKTIAFTMVFFLFIDMFFAVAGRYIPFIETIYSYTVFKLLYDIGTVSPDGSLLLRMILIPIITFVCFGIMNAWVYQRKEIK